MQAAYANYRSAGAEFPQYKVDGCMIISNIRLCRVLSVARSGREML